MLYSILTDFFFFYLYHLLCSFLRSCVHLDVGVGDILSKGTLVYACLPAHLFIKHFTILKKKSFEMAVRASKVVQWYRITHLPMQEM